MSAGLLEGRRAGCHRSVFQNQLDTSCDPGIGQFGADGHAEINTGSNTSAGDDVTVPHDASGVRDRTEERQKFAPGVAKPWCVRETVTGI
jgi:hypothetical protein